VRTLLYIEDNPANMTLVEEIIARRPDIRLLTAIDAIRGIRLCRDFHPEVILMDINLPEVSGIDALSILKEDPATARIPIIALTSNAGVRDAEYGMAVGFYRYLTKPIRIPEFLETLDLAFAFASKGKIQPGG